MTEDLNITIERKYEDLANIDLANKINNIRQELRDMEEMTGARTPKGGELHEELLELDEELRLRSNS